MYCYLRTSLLPAPPCRLFNPIGGCHWPRDTEIESWALTHQPRCCPVGESVASAHTLGGRICISGHAAATTSSAIGSPPHRNDKLHSLLSFPIIPSHPNGSHGFEQPLDRGSTAQPLPSNLSCPILSYPVLPRLVSSSPPLLSLLDQTRPLTIECRCYSGANRIKLPHKRMTFALQL